MLTEEQKLARKNGIGGSDAAAVAGVSKWRSPLQIYQEKKGEPQILSEASEKRFYWGHVLEPIVAQEYERLTGNKCLIDEKTILHPQHEWMFANIDRRVENKNIILECKTSDPYSLHEWGEPGTDKMPTQYLLQCAHYAIVCNAEKVDLAVLINLSDFRIYTYNRNEKLEKKLISIEERFWNDHILKDIPPDPKSPHEAASIWDDDGSICIADNSISLLAQELNILQDQAKSIELRKEDLKLQIQSHMKHSNELRDPFGKPLATWKEQVTNRFDTTTFKSAHPELYKQFIKPSISRVFRLKETT